MMMMTKKKQGSGGLRYVGLGFAVGIPRRDLTAAEVDEFGRELLLALQDPHTGAPMYEEMDGQESNEEVTDDGGNTEGL